MALHVDIFRVDPLAPSKHMLARVSWDGNGKVTVEAEDAKYWSDVLRRAAPVDPKRSPHEFLTAVGAHLSGTYVEVTEPHEADDCEAAHELSDHAHLTSQTY